MDREVPMKSEEILAGAEKRIEECRTREAKLAFTGPDGKPLGKAKAAVKLVNHEFKLGCNAFALYGISDPGLQKAYEDAFAGLLNYATLPFYWGSYEPERDKTGKERLGRMAAWCMERGIATKGHPLAWHEVFPKWADELPDEEVLKRQEARVREIVAKFRGRVDIWDVVNEASVSERFDNAIGRWIKKNGAAKCVAEALKWARESSGDALLLYNDFNISPEFEKLVQDLVVAGAPVGAIGVQSHMHQGVRSVDTIWNTCQTYMRFGLHLHFTEMTILSGRLKDPNEKDWHKKHTDWFSTPEGERFQLEAGIGIYTALFSHPAVEAITWWDFSDHNAWQGAPAGLVREDMSPKPFYDWLKEAFRKRWTTRASVECDDSGKGTARCFFGDYEAEVKAASGRTLKGRFRLSRRGPREVQVSCE